MEYFRTGMGSSSTKWMSFRDVVSEGLGNSDKGDYYQCVATILLVRGENCVYKACPSDNCNKKVVDMENGMYRCEKCNREYPNFKYRLLTSVSIVKYSYVSRFSTISSFLDEFGRLEW